MTAPRAPSATTAPSNASPSRSRDRVTTSPLPVTISNPVTAVARFPLQVARTVRGGRAGSRDRDVRQGRQVVQGEPRRVERAAQLAVADAAVDGHRSRGPVELEDRRGILRSETRSPVVSAMSLNEWREPRIRSDRLRRIISWSCSIDSASWSRAAS